MAISKILIWHQGAFGDLLLAAPALTALSRHFASARLTALGHPERWNLLAQSLPLEKVWDSGAAFWAPLFGSGALPTKIRERLAPFQMALVFSPSPQAMLQDQLNQAGIPLVRWVPSFPETGTEPVAILQAHHLAALGLHYAPEPFRLALENYSIEEPEDIPGAGPFLAVAPGSGQPRKNWPLSHYYEVTRALAWQFGLKVVWLAGPAEMSLLPYLSALAQAQGHLLLANLPLPRVARILFRCRLYIGNDSGLTHLAAAVAAPEVLALFGPTDPCVWAPRGPQVHALVAPCSQAPCAVGRTIPCEEPQCMGALLPESILAEARRLLEAQSNPEI